MPALLGGTGIIGKDIFVNLINERSENLRKGA